MLHLSLSWPVQSLHVGFWVLLTFPPCLEHFLFFWKNKPLQVHLVIFLLQPWNQPFLQRTLVLYGGKWALSLLILVEVSQSLSGDRARGTHTQLHLYLFLYLATYVENHEFIPIHPTPIQRHKKFILVFSFSILISPFSDNSKKKKNQIILIVLKIDPWGTRKSVPS